MRKGQEKEIQVEVLCILASLSIPNFDYGKLVKGYKVMEWIVGVLGRFEDGVARDDDFLLECVRWIGTMADDEGFLELVVEFDVIPLMLNLIQSIIFL